MELFKSRTRVVYTNAVGDKVYPVVVDIKKGIKSTEDIQFVSSDVNTGILSVAFISGNDNFNVSGADVVCSVMRPDASTLELPCEVVGENIVEVPLGINGTSQDGVYSFDFKVLKGGNKVVGTPIMNYSVSLSIGNDMAVEEDDRLPVLTMLITQVTELKDEAREVINQANTATEATKVATANAIEATNNANAVSERVSQEIATAIAEIKQDTENAIDSINQSTSTAISTMNQNTTDAIADMTQKTNEAVTRVNDNLTNINNTVATKVAELDTAKSDMTTTVSNKVNEVETRFNALTSSQQQDAEVIDARDGETSLKARLDRDIEKAKQVYVNVEGSHISTDSSVGYLKDVEILGNTIQSASNLADIRSVGEKVEGQELYEIPVVSCGKNINTSKSELGGLNGNNGTINNNLIDRFMRSADFIKVTPNSDIITNMNGYPAIFEYDENFDFIKYTSGVKIRTSENTRYLKFHWERTDITIPIQFEYGTVATPYEPYQEDKLTILSPVQLEKVGDVADRIIEKDGVWGVEKNVKLNDFPHRLVWNIGETLEKTTRYHVLIENFKNASDIRPSDANILAPIICNKFPTYKVQDMIGTDVESVGLSASAFSIRLNNDKLTSLNSDGVNNWIAENGLKMLYQTTQPQFIPLPHSQQVKLRTFANKTNISFLTEIEGTIKAQVPKSIGATVNTHTEQINNLNKELDRVKKLEESTVSTVETESDFTTVEATSNGYFEDVKLEGKTLVNHIGNFNNWSNLGRATISPDGSTVTIDANRWNCGLELRKDFSEGEYYFSINNKNNATIIIKDTNNNTTFYNGAGSNIRINITLSTKANLHFVIKNSAEVALYEVSNPLFVTDKSQESYFEGLKSVGQDVDEIVVSSVNENLIVDINKYEVGGGWYGSNLTGSSSTNISINSDNSINLKNNGNGVTRGVVYTIKAPKYTDIFIHRNILSSNVSNNMIKVFAFDKEGVNLNIPREDSLLLNPNYVYKLNTGNNSTIKVLFAIENIGECTFKASITFNENFADAEADKKRLLYYNNETQTWEKPILREWDSIEKHANGKYYYHQRSGEVVLNGSEDSWRHVSESDSENIISFNMFLNVGGNFNTFIALSDKFNYKQGYGTDADYENFFHANHSYTQFRINKSKLSTQDVAGFKQWLQANNVTVVYQLAEEKVYECTNIDLITYANETNYIVESGAISPKSILKVHNNISNVVKILQEKVSLLESNVKASQEVQDMMILETDMRMLDIELALMEFAPMKLNLGGSNMLRSATYFNFLKNHIINETYEKEYLENVMNKYLATGRINQDEYDELYKMLYPPVYDIELPIEP